jgi:hypothetical protein
MTPWLFAAAAAAYLAWQSRPAAPAVLPPLTPPAALQIPETGRAPRGPHPLTLAAILAAGAMIAFAIRSPAPAPAPAPGPSPATGLDLRGLFRGPEAAADAARTAALLAELADEIEWDGRRPEPRFKTGAAVHDLRTAARELRCQGVRLGERHPAVRDAIKAFLDAEAGTDGGPLDDAERARWVAAYRAVARAAEAAAR